MPPESRDPLQILSALPPDLAEKLAIQGYCEVNAVLIGNEINLKALTMHSSARKDSILTQLSDQSVAIVYPYGALVFFNATTAATVELIGHCQRFASKLFSTPETEQFMVIIQPDQPEGIVQKKVIINKVSKERFEIIGDALAKSLILEYHENRIGHLFDKVDPIAKSLKERGKLGYATSDILKHIGSSLLMSQEMVGKIQVTEKPQVLWEHDELEPLHAQLVEDLEILERQSSLERKIELISGTAQISLEVLQHSHGNRLEWYIIILIAIEISLQLYDLFFRSAL